MRQLLKDLLDSKQKLFDLQDSFSKSLEKRYPCLTGVDSDDFEKKVNKEIEFLLSSTVRIKSGRILIKALGSEWTKQVVLTRVPGLKRPHEPDSAFDLVNIVSIHENGDIVRTDPYEKEKQGIVKTSTLKESQMIRQDKLKDFYNYLKKVIEWSKILKDFIDPDYGDENVNIFVKESKIKICSRHFSFLIRNPESKKDSDEGYNEILCSHVIDFQDSEWRRERTLRDQKALLRLWNDYELFEKALLIAEKTKIELMKKGDEIYKELKEYNKPERLLNQLMKK